MGTIAPPGVSTQAPPSSTVALADLSAARADTLALVAHLDDSTLTRTLSPIMSPLVWDLAHIAAYEDLWLAHRHAGLELLRADLAELYDAFETPRAVRSEVQLLDPPSARTYLRDVRQRTVAIIEREGIGDGVIFELVLRHELQHSETMRQTLALAGLLPAGEPRLRPLTGEGWPAIGDGDWIEVPAGPFEMGATQDGFAYDNERPRHLAQTAAFAIARLPVSNAAWLDFSQDGGYQRREWWSQEGWAYNQEQELRADPAVALGHPGAPVCHISFFEANAFAQAHGARLPTETEWEKAAGSSPSALQGVGQVWEWTSSNFCGYPGFHAYPYREYSEVFFGEDYLVLRGGSWASSPRVASTTFRNWDYPQRRQIFAGLRLAKDLD